MALRSREPAPSRLSRDFREPLVGICVTRQHQRTSRFQTRTGAARVRPVRDPPVVACDAQEQEPKPRALANDVAREPLETTRRVVLPNTEEVLRLVGDAPIAFGVARDEPDSKKDCAAIALRN